MALASGNAVTRAYAALVSASDDIGRRVRETRKRRGLTQRELARQSGVSYSLLTKLESGAVSGIRLATVRKLAVPLGVTTSVLMSAPDAAPPDAGDVDGWAPLRQAIAGHHDDPPGEPPTIGGVRDTFADAVDAVLASRYSDLQALLPPLVRDADDLVSMSAGAGASRARQVRSDIRHLAAYMLGQTWQFGAAHEVIELAIGDADDDLTALAALDCQTWLLLREGRLAESRELAARWADAAEPSRISQAAPDELAAWGRLLVWVSAASMRDNRPGEAQEALRLAGVAAAAIGADAIPAYNPWEVFGPGTVSMARAEAATIAGRPDRTLGIGARVDGRRYPMPRNYRRHRLDVAHALVQTRQDDKAIGVLREIRAQAPEWLAEQRYAGDILSAVIGRRRTLNDDMRDLAEFLHLPV